MATWIEKAKLKAEDFLFPSRLHRSPHVSAQHYARTVEQWVTAAGLDPSAYGTHSMRRTKATLIYKRTKNLRARQPPGRQHLFEVRHDVFMPNRPENARSVRH